jgi:hypothetical protein
MLNSKLNRKHNTNQLIVIELHLFSNLKCKIWKKFQLVLLFYLYFEDHNNLKYFIKINEKERLKFLSPSLI